MIVKNRARLNVKKRAHSNNVINQKEDYTCLYMMTGSVFFFIFAL